MTLQNFDYTFRADVKKATTTEELDRIAFNRVRSRVRSESEPVRSILLDVLRTLRHYFIKD